MSKCPKINVQMNNTGNLRIT